MDPNAVDRIWRALEVCAGRPSWECDLDVEILDCRKGEVQDDGVRVAEALAEDGEKLAAGSLGEIVDALGQRSYVRAALNVGDVRMICVFRADANGFDVDCVVDQDVSRETAREFVTSWCIAVGRLGEALRAKRVECSRVSPQTPVVIWRR